MAVARMSIGTLHQAGTGWIVVIKYVGSADSRRERTGAVDGAFHILRSGQDNHRQERMAIIGHQRRLLYTGSCRSDDRR